MEGWMIGLFLNGTIGAAFIFVGVVLAVNLTRSGQWSGNSIATLFTFVAFTCGAGHALRAALIAGPTFGLFGLEGLATRVEFTDWHMWVADGLTAIAGLFYVTARTLDRDLFQTTRLFEDYRARRRRAIEVHDDVVQQLLEAKLSLEMGRREQARDALAASLDASQHIISDVSAIEDRPEEITEEEKTEAAP